MGAFFSNIQLYLNNETKEYFRDLVIAFIKSYLTKNGYMEIGEGEKADRTIAISEVVNGSWISIYDEAFEDQDIKLIDKFSSDLSGELKTRAIGIVVHDSDILRIATFQDRKFVGEYGNFKKRKNHQSSDDIFLKEILINGFSSEDFFSALSKKHVFAEEALKKISEITNMNYKNCTVGYNYLNDIEIEGLTYLRFKSKNKKDKSYEIANSTKLDCVEGARLSNIKVGEDGIIKIRFRNKGIPSKGIQVILKGPAIENNIIKATNVKLFIFKNYHEEFNEVSKHTRDAISTKNEKILVADFPEFMIPEGCILPNAWEAKNIKEMSEIMKKQRELGVGVKIGVTCLEEARSTFYVFVLPLSNPIEGQDKSPVWIND